MEFKTNDVGAVLARLLECPWLRDVRIPFAVSTVTRDEWGPVRLTQNAANNWTVSSRSVQGLEADWHLVYFPETASIECWGEVVHRGDQPLCGVTGLSAWSVPMQFSAAEGLPWIRKFNGAEFIATAFPAHDFAYQDRRMVETAQVYNAYTLKPFPDGRSSNGAMPFAVLCDGQKHRAVACAIEWSGMWEMSFRQSAVDYGVKPDGYQVEWSAGMAGLKLDLMPGEKLPMPRVVLAVSPGGLDAGCSGLRRHIRRHITPKLAGGEPLPPTSFNHWFAFDNDFNEESLSKAVPFCAEAGLEYFCVDGGWFTGGFRLGIGNWSEGDVARFPKGIKPFSDLVRASGMKYGTWFEPEYAHEDSEIYRAHPEWFWRSPSAETRPSWAEGLSSWFTAPHTHLMNFGLSEVREWWVNRFVRAYEEWGMRWVRWDFNQVPRLNWEEGVPTGKIGWRQIEHITGLYTTLDEIMKACPDLLIEQCASGGNRVDVGLARRGHTFWMNDHTTNTDLVRSFQVALNRILPGNYPNTNLCQKRHDFTDYDFLSHGLGGFGFSGRVWEMPRPDFERFKSAISRFKAYRHLLLENFETLQGNPGDAQDFLRATFGKPGAGVAFTFNSPGVPPATASMDPLI